MSQFRAQMSAHRQYLLTGVSYEAVDSAAVHGYSVQWLWTHTP